MIVHINRRGRFSTVAVLSVIGFITGLLMLSLTISSLWANVRRADSISRFYLSFDIAALPLNLMLVVVSVGAFRYRPWAMRWFVRWAVLVLAYALVRAVVAITWLAPEATRLARAAAVGKPPTEFGPQFAGMMITVVALAALAITSILPILVLILLRRSIVRNAFDCHPPSAPSTGARGEKDSRSQSQLRQVDD